MQWPLMVESDSVFFKLSAKRKANSWISYHLSKRYQTLKKTKANVIKLSGTHWQPTNTCTVWHLLTSPGSARTALRRRRSHTLAFCRSTQTVRPPHVYIDVWFTGVFLIEPVVLECSSPAASWPSHFHQHLQTILENSSFQQQFWLTVCHCLLHIYVGWFGGGIISSTGWHRIVVHS